MIAKPSTLSFPPDLQMPLRDALRGIASLADATEDMLEPAAQLLPEPLRSRFHNALTSLEQAGKALTHSPIDIKQIETASRFLKAAETGKEAVETCATVFVYAWEHLNEASVSHSHLISETIVADRLARTHSTSRLIGVDFAAAVLADIRSSSAIGLMPGLTRGINGEEETEVDLVLLSVTVWLLSGRAETLADEQNLLDLSIALVRALQIEAQAVFEDGPRLAHFLSDTSAHL